MSEVKHILSFYLVSILFFSCLRTEKERSIPELFDIIHYCEVTERQISLIAKEIELDGIRASDVNGFRKLDSCLLLRKQLFKINGDSLNILKSAKFEYNYYLAYLKTINEPDQNQELEQLFDESALGDIPSKINLKYILSLVRFEHAVIEEYLPSIAPVYCGWGNRVFSMQDNSRPFRKDQVTDLLLISDFSTSKISDFRLSFFVDSVKFDGKKLNIVKSLITIDRIAHLKMQIPKKGNYWIYGRTKLDWKSQQDTLTLAVDSHPFSTVISIE